MTKPTIDDLEVLTPDQLRVLLHYEVKQASPDVQHIKDLIAVGCPIDFNDEFNSTPLHWLNTMWPLELLELFLSNGVEINSMDKSGRTALHRAVVKGNLRIVEFLVSRGAQVSIRDSFFKNALDYAITQGDPDMVDFIRSRRPRVGGILAFLPMSTG